MYPFVVVIKQIYLILMCNNLNWGWAITTIFSISSIVFSITIIIITKIALTIIFTIMTIIIIIINIITNILLLIIIIIIILIIIFLLLLIIILSILINIITMACVAVFGGFAIMFLHTSCSSVDISTFATIAIMQPCKKALTDRIELYRYNIQLLRFLV